MYPHLTSRVVQRMTLKHYRPRPTCLRCMSAASTKVINGALTDHSQAFYVQIEFVVVLSRPPMSVRPSFGHCGQ